MEKILTSAILYKIPVDVELTDKVSLIEFMKFVSNHVSVLTKAYYIEPGDKLKGNH